MRYPVVIDGVIYETQEEHELRMSREQRRFQSGKKKSRTEAARRSTRKSIIRDASWKCQICDYGFAQLLHVHHILPVQAGGSAHESNLIAVCRNCHGLIHHFGPLRSKPTKDRLEHLQRCAGLSEEQARRALLVASTHAYVNTENQIVAGFNEPKTLPLFIIVDAPDSNPDHLTAYNAELQRCREFDARVGWRRFIQHGPLACQQP